jgi:hypothetical protein
MKLLSEGIALVWDLREGGVFTAVPCCFGQESCGEREGIRFRIGQAKLKVM